MYFNAGSNILVEYFSQCGVTVSKTLFDHILAKDTKRIVNSKKNNEQKQHRIQRKATDRQNSIRATSDITDYNPGGFNF
jgi:hypothetical protein